jgi:hypothetical protein
LGGGLTTRWSRPGVLWLILQNAEQFKKDNEETSAIYRAELLPIEKLGNEAGFYNGPPRVRTGYIVLQIGTLHPEAAQEQALTITQKLARSALTGLP